MFEFFFLVLWGTLSVISESLLRTFGIPLPLTAIFVFICAYILSSWWGAISAVLFGTSLDLLFGSSFPLSGLVYMLLALPALNTKRTEPENTFSMAFSGFMIPFAAALPHCANYFKDIEQFPHLIFSSFLSIFLLPILFAFYQRQAKQLKIGRFRVLNQWDESES